MTIFTVGHSTHPIDEFIGILKAHGIRKLIDVRTVPKSRHNPQFNGDALAASVRASGITYRRMESLGGLRHARKDSPNGAWRNASFRGYADYMQTEEFSSGHRPADGTRADQQFGGHVRRSRPVALPPLSHR